MTKKDLYHLLDNGGIFPWSYDRVKKRFTFFTANGSCHYNLLEISDSCLNRDKEDSEEPLFDLLEGRSIRPVKLLLNLSFTGGENSYLITVDPLKSTQGLLTKITRRDSWKQRGFDIIDTLPLGILIKDLKDRGRFLYCNPRLIELHGVHEKSEDMIGFTDWDLYTKEEAERYQKDDWFAVEQGRCTYIGQFTAHDRNGTIINTYKIPLYDNLGKPDLLIAMMEDVSETELIQEELHQARKMEAMGLLAGGMAHDFNNMLTCIMGYADLLLNGDIDKDTREEYLRVILASSQQAASLTNTLLSYSRKQKVKIVRVDLNRTVAEAHTILKRTIDKSINIVPMQEFTPLFIKGDHSLILNILLNLGLNARDAMASGGSISIKLERIKLHESDRRKLNLESHRYIRLIFTDTGCGIPEEIRDRVFDPFFSTKEQGKGTGLGLSTVYSSMKKLNGMVELFSETSRGTSFHLYFCPWED